MRAMGIPYTAAHGTIRFSLSRYSTEAEIDRVIEAVPPIIAPRLAAPGRAGSSPVSAACGDSLRGSLPLDCCLQKKFINFQ